MALLDNYQDGRFSKNLTKIIAFGVLILSILLSIVAGSSLPQGTSQYLLLSALVVFAVAQTEKEKEGELVRANFFGDSKGKTYIILLFGLGIGTFLGLAARAGTLSLYMPTQGIYLGGFLEPLFANVIAPILEALFWRCVMFPIAISFFTGLIGEKNKTIAKIMGLVAIGLLFGFFHIKAFGQENLLNTYNLIETAALFGMFFTIGSYFFKTIAFEIGWHFANNMFSQGYEVSAIFAGMAVFLVSFFILAETVDKLKRS